MIHVSRNVSRNVLKTYLFLEASQNDQWTSHHFLHAPVSKQLFFLALWRETHSARRKVAYTTPKTLNSAAARHPRHGAT